MISILRCVMQYLETASHSSTVNVNLNAFSYARKDRDAHVEYYVSVLDAVVDEHGTFSIVCNAASFSVWHLPALEMLKNLAVVARQKYKKKLTKVVVSEAPTVLRIAYTTLVRPFVPKETAEKISFVG